jgi:adenylate kinase family enzyme
MNTRPRRIIIIGDAGRGKSTLAKALSEKTGIPCHSTDDYFYEIKFTKPRDRQESIEEISKNYEKEEWIVEGTTRHLLEPGLAAADLIVYLKYDSIFYQWLVLFRRYMARKEESLKGVLQLMKHVFYKRYGLGYKKGKMTHMELIAPYRDKVIELSSFKHINDFIKEF